MKKKIKDLTRTEMDDICDAVSYKCEICPLYNKRNRACAKAYFDTLTSKFDYEEMNKKVEVMNNIFYKLIDEMQQLADSDGSHHIDTNILTQIFQCTKVVEIIRAKLVNFNRLNRAEHNWKEDGCSSPVEYYNEGIVDYCQLTEEEYNFLTTMVGIRD